jgi:hypothetical protein
MPWPIRPFTVVCARSVGGHRFESPGLASCDRVADGCAFGEKRLNTEGLQPAQSAHPDAPYNHAVDFFAGKEAERLTHSVTVVAVVVGNCPELSARRVHDHEEGRGAEMTAQGTLEPPVIGDRYAQIHLLVLLVVSLVCVCQH